MGKGAATDKYGDPLAHASLISGRLTSYKHRPGGKALEQQRWVDASLPRQLAQPGFPQHQRPLRTEEQQPAAWEGGAGEGRRMSGS